jgi:hypothetical protein
MNYKEIRLRIPSPIHKRFKIICVEMDLSLPKQTCELIRKFVEVQEDNRDKLRSLGK